jgi:hypothetical protein
MSNIFERGMAWHTYLGLERDLIETTRYVALAPENSATWSTKIAQLLQLVGGSVDSVFNEMRKSSFLPQTEPVTKLRDKAEPNIADYREVYEPIFLLSGVEVQAHHGLTNYGVIKPFEAFLRKSSPDWWGAYNEVKHEFFENVRKGTLNNLIHALGGLFVLNVLHKESQRYLLRMGTIQMGKFDRRMAYWPNDEQSFEHIKTSYVGIPDNVTWDVWATSEIFLHRFRKDPTAKS